MRNRIKVKSGLVGSSDFSRVKAHRAALEENHKKNVDFFTSIRSNEAQRTEVEITEKYLLSRYSEVKVFGIWKPTKTFVGALVFMYNQKFAMR